MSSIKEIVNDPEWQTIRASFVGTWNLHPVENCEILRRYLDDFSDPLRIRRVHNYLTGSGFRLGKIVHPEINRLLNEIRKLKYGKHN